MVCPSEEWDKLESVGKYSEGVTNWVQKLLDDEGYTKKVEDMGTFEMLEIHNFFHDFFQRKHSLVCKDSEHAFSRGSGQ